MINYGIKNLSNMNKLIISIKNNQECFQRIFKKYLLIFIYSVVFAKNNLIRNKSLPGNF